LGNGRGRAFNHSAATPIARYAWPVDAASAKPRDCIDDRISNGRGNETHSLSLMPAPRVNSGTAKQKDRPKAVTGNWQTEAAQMLLKANPPDLAQIGEILSDIIRDEHSSDGVRSVSLVPERKRQFAKPPLHPIRVDVRKILTVHTRCALVGAALGISMGRDVLTAGAVAGWDLHPLESAAFSRRTPIADIDSSEILLSTLASDPISQRANPCCNHVLPEQRSAQS